MRHFIALLFITLLFAMPVLCFMAKAPPAKTGTFSWQALRSWFQKKQPTAEKQEQTEKVKAYQQKQDFMYRWLHFWQSSKSMPHDIKAELQQRLETRHQELFKSLKSFERETITDQEIIDAQGYLKKHGWKANVRDFFAREDWAPIVYNFDDWFLRRIRSKIEGLFARQEKPIHALKDIHSITDVIAYHQRHYNLINEALKKIKKASDISDENELARANFWRRQFLQILEQSNRHIQEFLSTAPDFTTQSPQELGIDKHFENTLDAVNGLEAALGYYNLMIEHMKSYSAMPQAPITPKDHHDIT
jgi:hypothetical protein